MLFMTNVFLLAGIGSTIANYSTSVIQGEAFTNRTITINRSLSAIPIGTIAYTDSNTYTITDSGASQTVSITGSFFSSSSQTFIQFKQGAAKTSAPIDDRRGWWSTTATPGYITKITITPTANGSTGTARIIAPILSSSQTVGKITSFTSDATNAPSFATKEEVKNVMGSTTVSTPVEWTFSRNKMYRYFNFTPNSNHAHYYNSVVIEYDVPESDLEAVITFSDYFLTNTNNKNGQCTIGGLNWTNLSDTYNTLTTNQKSLFVANSANSSVADAVSRYLYLRSFNATLTNFANL